MTTMDITTIAFPAADLLDAVRARVDENSTGKLNFVIWNGTENPQGTSVDDIDAVILPYLGTAETLARLPELPNLKFVQGQSTGYDGVLEAAGPGVAVSSASGVHAAATAELAVGLALASLRGIDDAARDMREEKWSPTRRLSLADRRVLLIGVGGIGEEIAKRLDPFEVDLTRVGTRERDDERGHVFDAGDLPRLLPTAEVVILITPLTDETHHLVDKDFLARLPDGALIVNVARGPVVDTDALVAELASGRLHAALDVVDPEPLPEGHPLWRTPNTLVTPHVGGNTSAFVPRIENLLAEQLRRICAGEDLMNRVDA
ncbi:2-hydroxyacid dehydrogenase [Saxibacter everestensis]|uniref:2-hydroxyacid dehydrogenase n=1 Tax=Saxibacter everestensis TaxID=2909229 RepID=A0ABY8QXP7_9MICO|nr:2-hydroxyacid dehydrogenase [Brevibacteriaceae bacterium ZFBP1038]